MSQKSELVPKRRFKEFENAGDWEQRELGDFVIKAVDNRGKTPPTQEFGRYPLLEVASLGKASPDYTKVTKYVDEETYNGWFRAYIKKDDILFSTVGNTGLVTLMDGYAGATIAQNIVGFRAIEGNNPQFLVQMFQLPENLKRAKRIEMGAVQPSIKVSQLIHVSYLLPNSEQEQEKIGSFFKHLDDTITLHQRKLDKLNNIKQSYLYQMFPQNGEKVPSLRFSEFSEEWKSNRMGELGKTYTGLNGKTKDDFGHGKAKFVTYMNVYKNTISNPNLVEEVELDSRQNEVKYGDVLFTTSSETPEEVGLSSVWLNNSENVYLNSFCFGYRLSINIDSYYLAYMLRSQSIRKKIILLAQGISRYNISKSKMMDIEIVFPKLEEQKKIGQFFKQLDETIDIQEQELEKLKNLKKAYLNEMFV
ncbi:restriction endonuclease subunit S [Aerococcus urinaeequi]|uniref:restriction endonuclease subunit S n=1 Tax=Aerococcus urinaeequi TaxID=51665 RepID=UPI003B3AFF35